jgi:hypothetical protein
MFQMGCDVYDYKVHDVLLDPVDLEHRDSTVICSHWPCHLSGKPVSVLLIIYGFFFFLAAS